MSQHNTTELINAYLAMREAKEEIYRNYRESSSKIEDQMDKIEQVLLEICKEADTDSLRTDAGTAYKKISETYMVADWDAFKGWIREHDAVDLLQQRVNNTNMKQFLEENPDLTPPVNLNRKYTIAVRRK